MVLITALCGTVGYALWSTDSTPERDTAQLSEPVAADAGQPVKLPPGFGDAFIDRPVKRLGNPPEGPRLDTPRPESVRPETARRESPPRAGDGAAAPPAREAASAPPPAAPAAPVVVDRPPVQPALPAAPPAGPATVTLEVEKVQQGATPPPVRVPDSQAAALAVEPSAGPPALPVESKPAAAEPAAASDTATLGPAETTTPAAVPVPIPVPRARIAAAQPQPPRAEVEERAEDSNGRRPPPEQRESVAIVAAPLRPVTIPPPPVNVEPLTAEREGPARSLEPARSPDDDELPIASSRNVPRALVTTNIRDREPANNVGTSVRLREIDRGQLHFFTEITGMMGRKVEHRWTYRGQPVGTMSFQVGSNRWRTSSRKTILPHQKGEWRVLVVDEAGRTLGGSRFVVE